MNRSMAVVTASLMMWNVGAGAETVAAEIEPQLQISRLAGRIEVETPNRKESVSGQKLPYIRSGSIVRVLSGSVMLRSETGATVRARTGDVFHYSAIVPESDRPAAMRIAAVEAAPKTLEVSVGERNFQVGEGGVVSVSRTGRGEATVVAERDGVKLASGSATMDGTARDSAHRMEAGETLIVSVPEAARRGHLMAGLPGVSVSRKNDTTYVATGGGRPFITGVASAQKARRALAEWPEDSRVAAEAMLERYGSPEEFDEAHASWHENGDWLKTTVHRLPAEGQDVLEQSIRYAAPQEKVAALTVAGIGLSVDVAAETLSATSESEATNYLALNLADEIVREKMTPAEAREFYLRTVKLGEAGKESPYTQGLLLRR